MAIEAAERFIPSDNGVSHAFDVMNVLYGGHLGDEEYLRSLIEFRQHKLFVEYIHAGIGWLANRSASPFLQNLGTKVWKLLGPGPQPIVTAFTTDSIASASQITGQPQSVVKPPGFVPESIISTRSHVNGKPHLIVPIHFFLHAQRHPVEGMSHLAGAISQINDIVSVDWDHLPQQRIMTIMAQMASRALASSTQILLGNLI